MSTLRYQLGSSFLDETLVLPAENEVVTALEWEAIETALLNQIKAHTIDRAAIHMGPAGVSLNNNQQAEWDLTLLTTANPHVVSYERFLPVLLHWDGTYSRQLTDFLSDWDLYVNEATSKLILRNQSGSAKVVYGFVLFVQPENYITGFGRI